MSEEVLGNSKVGRLEMPAAQTRVALQSILGFAQLLQLGQDELSPAQQRYLASIESAAATLVGLASSERVRPGRLIFERVVIDLDAAIGTVLARLRSLADAHGVRLQADRSGLSVVGDREQLEQMLLNLVGCAIRSGGGSLRINARRLGDAVQISLNDTRIEIPPEVTTAKRLAEMMGGELEWIHGDERRTAVTVRLPAPAPGVQVSS